jgi:hypothetical protein
MASRKQVAKKPDHLAVVGPLVDQSWSYWMTTLWGGAGGTVSPLEPNSTAPMSGVLREIDRTSVSELPVGLPALIAGEFALRATDHLLLLDGTAANSGFELRP